MLQVRKLVLAVAAATAVTSGVAHALGLGNVSVKSSLNQPLEAEIELLEVGGLTALEIKSQLASSEEFSRAGVERQFFLSGLEFTPVVNANGKSVIRVTSENSVREPYLNFLVELLWPNGRMLREYTLLLDPPMYTPQEVVYTPASIEPESSARASTQPVTRQPTPTARTTPAAPAAPRRAELSDDTYRIKKNDTLWGIASRMGGNAIAQQTMLAIRDLNPNAFINGDINRIKAGHVLTLPNESQIQSHSRAAAIAEVHAQTVAKSAVAKTSQAQLDARRRTSAGAAPARVEQQDSLRLVATETGEAATGSEHGANDGAAVLAELTAAKEMLDSSQRENLDLREQVDELNEQVSKLQQLIELKNTQLANLQNLELDAEQEQLLADAEAEAEQQLETDTQVESTEAVDTEFDVADLADIAAIDMEADTQQELEASAEELTSEPEPAAAPAPVEQSKPEPKPEPKPATPPVVQEAPQPEQSLVDELMANPLFLPAVGGGSLLLALLLLMSASRRRKKAKEAAEQEAFAEEDSLSFGSDLTDADADEQLPVFESEPEVATTEATPEASPKISEETINAITEADNYIAYGRFNQAADVLVQAIDKNPQRADLRFKLLEVFADLDDKSGFNRQLEELEEMGVSRAELETVKARYPQLVEDDVAVSLDEIGLDMPVTDMPEADASGLDDVPELDIEGFAADEPEEHKLDDDLSDDFLAGLDVEQPLEESGDDIEKALHDLDELSITLDDEPDVAEQVVEEAEEILEMDDLETELLASAEAEAEPEPEPEPQAESPISDDEFEATLDAVDELTRPSQSADTEDSSAAEIDFDAIASELDNLDFSIDAEPGAEQAATEPEPAQVEPETDFELDLPEDFDLSVTDEIDSGLDSDLSIDEPDSVPDFASINAELDELAELTQEKPVSEAEPASTELDLEAELATDLPEPESLDEEADTLDFDSLELSSEELDGLDFSGLEDSLEFEGAAELDATSFDSELDDIESSLLEDEVELTDAAPAAQDTTERPVESTFAALEESLEDDFDFLAGTDETTTKLDLAQAFVDMGDSEGAKDILEEVLSEGDESQQQQARELMKKLS